MHKTIDRDMAAIVGEMAAFDRDLAGVDGEMAAFDRDLAYTKKMAKSRLRIISCFFLTNYGFIQSGLQLASRQAIFSALVLPWLQNCLQGLCWGLDLTGNIKLDMGNLQPKLGNPSGLTTSWATVSLSSPATAHSCNMFSTNHRHASFDSFIYVAP